MTQRRLVDEPGHSLVARLSAITALVLVAACKREAAPVEVEKEVTKASSASPDSSAAALRPPAEPPKPEPVRLEFEVVAKVPKGTEVQVSGAQLIACDPCNYPGEVAFQAISRGGVKPLPVEPLSPLLDRFYGKDFSTLKERFPGGPSLHLGASREGDIRLELRASYDDDGISRNGYDSLSDSFLHRAGKWGKIDWTPLSQAQSVWGEATDRGATPRRYDDALAVSPLASGQVVSGGSGPLMVLAEQEFALFLGAEWKRFPLASKVEHAVRLSDGSTLLDGSVVLRVAPDGATSVLIADAERRGTWWRSMLVGKEPWLLRQVGDQIDVMAPSQPVSVVAPERREPFAAVVAPESGAVAEDAAGAGSGGSAAAPTERPFELATNFTPDCRTPFVTLSTPPKAGWHYDATAKALVGAPFVGIRFFEVASPDGVVFFGAEAADEAAARGLMERFQKAIPRSKPQLQCWDVASRVPDRYAPPPGFREVLLNPITGTEYAFLR